MGRRSVLLIVCFLVIVLSSSVAAELRPWTPVTDTFNWLVGNLIKADFSIQNSITGARVVKTKPGQANLDIYDLTEDGILIGTADPKSKGKRLATMAGNTVEIVLSNVEINGVLNSGATVDIKIRQGSKIALTLVVVVSEGESSIEFKIPIDWDGNYHVRVDITLKEFSFHKEAEFKVVGGVPPSEEPPAQACVDGETRNCGNEKGTCSFGTQTCVDGHWGKCEGAAEPSAEVCDNLDNDCDEEIDENLLETCGVTDVGACSLGQKSCLTGAWSVCSGSVEPEIETCNNIDDDCDGEVDNGILEECGSDVGICQKGTRTCSEGQFGECVGAIEPRSEICDGLDNDCDGQIDEEITCTCTEGQTQNCGSDVGACSVGVQTCTNGDWGECVGAIDPIAELCDGIDNDCDGEMDEELVQQCGDSDIGACQFGTQACSNATWGSCDGVVGPILETCNDIDDDCDGSIDESLARECGDSDVGACSLGFEACINGVWGVCEGAVNPVEEVCGDGLDNNCDGTVDDNCPVAQPPVEPPEEEPTPEPRRGGGRRRAPPQPVVVPEPIVEKRLGGCSKDDICVPGCTVTDPDCIDVELKIINPPKVVDITDPKIIIQAEVVNNGEDVENVEVVATTLSGWTGATTVIDSLKSGDSIPLEFIINSDLCNLRLRPGNHKFKPEDLDSFQVNLLANHASGELDRDEAVAKLRIPPFAVMTAPNDYSKSDLMKTCFIINNFDREKRDRLEIEFELSDVRDDLLIDFISRLNVDEDETLIKVRNYYLKNVPRQKPYYARASLFEQGAVFQAGYRSADAFSQVDLSNAEKQLSGFEVLRNWFRNLFAGMRGV